MKKKIAKNLYSRLTLNQFSRIAYLSSRHAVIVRIISRLIIWPRLYFCSRNDQLRSTHCTAAFTATLCATEGRLPCPWPTRRRNSCKFGLILYGATSKLRWAIFGLFGPPLPPGWQLYFNNICDFYLVMLTFSEPSPPCCQRSLWMTPMIHQCDFSITLPFPKGKKNHFWNLMIFHCAFVWNIGYFLWK